MSRNTGPGGPVDYSAILDHLRSRAETAEAELADARERLRQAEERLAAVKALHRKILDGEHCLSCLVRWPCPTTSELQ